MSMKVQTTKIFAEIEEARKRGYTTISAQGSSRSSKTYNILIWLIVYCLRHPDTSASIVRATLPAIKGSVYRDFKEILINMGVFDEKALNKSEMIYTFANGSFVEFFSTDSEQKLRGRKRKILYVNEGNELLFIEWQQLKMRTTEMAIIDYNPSFSDEHWLCELNRDNRTYHFVSTYKDNPFLEQVVIDEIESLQHKNKSLWQVYGLGMQAIVEGLIFPEIEIVDEFPDYCNKVAIGMDFGFTHDPTAMIKCGIYNDSLYMDELCYKTHLLTSEIITELKQYKLHIYPDSADPRLIQEISNAGLIIYPIQKAQGSIMAGLTKMMEFKLRITRRSINLIKEFKNYTYLQNKDGKWLNQPIDAYNHGIDAVRYYVLGMLLGKIIKPKKIPENINIW
jgi:phage terminase large subunit